LVGFDVIIRKKDGGNCAGADVNLPDKDGITPLAHANNRHFSDIVKILENYGGKTYN